MNRIKILQMLIDNDFSCNQAAFARRIKKPASLVSQWLSGHRLIGDASARHVEITLSLPLGFFDGKSTSAPTTTRDKSTSNFVIPQFEVSGSMGGGLFLPDQPGKIHEWQVTREWLEKNARSHTGLGNLAIVTGFGDSMRPIFNPGDPLLVDTGVKTVIADGVYFFRIGSEGFIKRLQRIPTENGMLIKALSQNPEYVPFDITGKMDFEVLARVVRIWCGTDY